jgi:hypothetical protein
MIFHSQIRSSNETAGTDYGCATKNLLSDHLHSMINLIVYTFMKFTTKVREFFDEMCDILVNH